MSNDLDAMLAEINETNKALQSCFETLANERLDFDFDGLLAANDEIIQDLLASLDESAILADFDFDAMLAEIAANEQETLEYLETLANERLDLDAIFADDDLAAILAANERLDFDFGDFDGL